MHLWVHEGGGDRLAGKRILHFAPEKTVIRKMRGNPLYETADLHQPLCDASSGYRPDEAAQCQL